MNKSIVTRIIPVLLLAGTAFADGETKKEVIIRHHAHAAVADAEQSVEKEKVSFLGVSTMPVDPALAVQLGLSHGTGLVVREVLNDSPVSNLLKKYDVLTKLDDQILVNTPQLGVLVRNHKVGDEVKLTLVRDGKETTVKAKLAEHEVPKMAGDFGLPGFGDGPGGNVFFQHGVVTGEAALAGPEAGDVMRTISGDHMRWFAQPRVHVFKHEGGKGATILDLPAGNFLFLDDQGSVELNNNEGKRELTVKDKKGTVTFQGPLNTPEDHKNLPPEVLARLDAIGGADLDDDDGGLEVETKVLAPTTKTQRILPSPREPAEGMRTL